ncbi:hypothetical protein VUR80DRAFT_3403 [Thermomyces stellatus]
MSPAFVLVPIREGSPPRMDSGAQFGCLDDPGSRISSTRIMGTKVPCRERIRQRRYLLPAFTPPSTIGDLIVRRSKGGVGLARLHRPAVTHVTQPPSRLKIGPGVSLPRSPLFLPFPHPNHILHIHSVISTINGCSGGETGGESIDFRELTLCLRPHLRGRP